MVPDGWSTKSLADITKEKISYGIVQAGPHVEDGVPYLKSSDVGGEILVDALQKTSPAVHHKYRRSAVHPGDIVFSLRGNIGECSIVPDELSEANLTQGTARISVSSPHSTEFVRYQITSTPVLNRIHALSKGSTFKEISLEELRKLQIFLPQPSEQDRIAEILSTWDRAIAATEELIANGQAQKKALMQQLLTGKKRLPGFDGEWQLTCLSTLTERITRRNDGGDHPILTISSTAGFVRQDEKYSRYMAGRSVENYIQLRRGEFAYNKGNSKTYEFGCVFDLQGYDEALVPHVYVCFSLNKGCDHQFFSMLFKADYLRPQLGRVVNTGVRNNGLLNITPAEFFKCKVPVPPINEQHAIAQVLVDASNSISILEKKLDFLKSEKAALMQQLLTGKRRVKIEEAANA